VLFRGRVRESGRKDPVNKRGFSLSPMKRGWSFGSHTLEGGGSPTPLRQRRGEKKSFIVWENESAPYRVGGR